MKISLLEALQKASFAYSNGQYETALSFFRLCLSARPDDATLNHNIGLILAKMNQASESLPYLLKAIDGPTMIPQFWKTCIEVHIELEKFEDAQILMEKAKELNIDIASFKSKISETTERVVISSPHQDPSNEEFHTLITSYKNKDYNTALQNALSLKDSFPNSAAIYNLLGLIHAALNSSELAEIAYEKAIAIKPKYAVAFNNLGILYSSNSKHTLALAKFKKAISLNPKSAEIYVNLGNSYQAMDDLDSSIKAYKAALDRDPKNLAAWCNGAEILEKWNKLDELTEWLKKSKRVFTESPADLTYFYALHAWRHNQKEEASKILFTLQINDISKARKTSFLSLKGKCSEYLDKYDDAFKCFYEMNALIQNSAEFQSLQPQAYKENLNNILNITRQSPKQPQLQFDEQNSNHIFLVGFPRSGTTLLDTILMSHTSIKVMEELPAMGNAIDYIGEDDIASILNGGRDNTIKIARQVYKKTLEEHNLSLSHDEIIIDKLPLNIVYTPIIHTMFPHAKFILLLRHPVDCLLSCWMQNFSLNSAMANMVDLDNIAELYNLSMSIFQLSRKKYNLNVHVLRYEDLVTNKEFEIKALLSFLKLNWQESLSDHVQTALKRGKIITPSYSQVIQPIYNNAQYRWLKYHKFLGTQVDDLKNWIEEFKYENTYK